MRNTLLLAALALAGLAAWKFAHREPPDITEAQARALADNALMDFCLSEKSICPDFVLKGEEPPTDNRFHWGYHFLNVHTDPWKKVFISVGKKGELSVEFTTMAPAFETLPPDFPAPGASPAASPPGSAPPPEVPPESRPPGP